MLVEEFGWIEIYFSGETQDCCTVLNAVKEAIGPCAKLLGYKASALQYDLLFACCLPEHKDRKLHLVESVNIDTCKAKCNRTYPLNIERQFCWFTGKFLLYILQVVINAILLLGYTKLCSGASPILTTKGTILV